MGNMAAGNAAGKRINSLLDAGSFVEIGGAVTARTTDFNMQEKETPADGVITGYGVIDGNLVYVYSQDATVLNGAIGEMHAKKISNIYDMAMKMGAPVIGLVGSNRCIRSIWKALSETVNGFRSDPSDHSNLRNMRRWTFYRTCSDRFYIYGSKER